MGCLLNWYHFNLPSKVGIKIEDIGKRVEEQEVLIATASININQPFSTFHTSREAVRGPGVHLPWPPIAISPPNDAFFLGHMQID